LYKNIRRKPIKLKFNRLKNIESGDLVRGMVARLEVLSKMAQVGMINNSM
jgi:hypothetical protein